MTHSESFFFSHISIGTPAIDTAPPAGLILKHLTCLYWADVLSPEGARQAGRQAVLEIKILDRELQDGITKSHLMVVYLLLVCAHHFK